MTHDPSACPHCIHAGLTTDHWTQALKPHTTTEAPMTRPDIVIPSSEGPLFGPVNSVRNAEDAARAIDRLLGRTPS